MSQRTDLLESIANTIQDYRGGSLPQPLTADLGASPSAAPATPAAPLVVVLRGNTVVL